MSLNKHILSKKPPKPSDKEEELINKIRNIISYTGPNTDPFGDDSAFSNKLLYMYNCILRYLNRGDEVIEKVEDPYELALRIRLLIIQNIYPLCEVLKIKY